MPSPQIDFKKVTRVKEGHLVIIKCSIYLESIIISTYVCTYRASKYVKQKLAEIEGEIENSIISESFKIPLLILDRITQ